MDEFQRTSVHIKNPERVEQILCQLIAGGKEKLQVVTDFDQTLSRFALNGKRCPSCHGIIDTSPLIPDFYRNEAKLLKEKYYAIEIASDMTEEEKLPFMIEWWTKSHSLLVTCDLNKTDIQDMVKKSGAMLRDGCDIFFSNLHKHGVPLLIFSAGVGDILEEIIKQQGHFHSNVQVVSNYMDFSEEGKLVGFQGDMIHTYNKNQTVLHQSNYFEKIENRSNVILLGDTLGDLTMADGVKNIQNCLTIGYLNDKIDERLDKYKDNYDVVLVGDESVDIVNAVLRKIL
ncbi:cytosolic 5'-nucleotidase 3-like [Glandiceps talaboti]